ncbi:hypothetical protein [Desulfosporosinus acididurans]|uniref:hypothetical protein n=1 Tax=Desulfosporosinus acididurans TaxID=476652 RepID=UPI000649CD2A|nr:hypothetical protein [Desulfosporosinus acididurans]
MVNLFNGLGAGFIGPMISYWFATRFGVSSSEIGLTLALSFVFAGGYQNIYHVEVVKVDYEFQKGGNKMLIIRNQARFYELRQFTETKITVSKRK